LEREGIRLLSDEPVRSLEFGDVTALFRVLDGGAEVVVGLGGGKALDAAKYVAFLAGLPFVAVPTSLSNDGFASPQSSLTMGGRRVSLASAIPFGVVIDTAVCLAAPLVLWHAGVGDLVSKVTAVEDWKIAFHVDGTPVDDFAALLAESSVYQFAAHPYRDAEGVRLLATALLLNGLAMGIGGSSRPASGSEHLISHALDRISARPRLHGLQVGVASAILSRIQNHGAEFIASILEETGFWQTIHSDPFDYAEWIEAVRVAPSIKAGFTTILSTRDCLPEIERLLADDPRFASAIRLAHDKVE
jgi:glycerol-1-phosphate dehydrogenase [NAD(P)+]